MNSIKNIFTNIEVFNNLVKLKATYKSDLKIKKIKISKNIVYSMADSPTIKEWVKAVVFSSMCKGDNGIEELINQISTEKNIALGSTKIDILIEILKELPIKLEELKDEVENGDLDLKEMIDRYDQSIENNSIH